MCELFKRKSDTQNKMWYAVYVVKRYWNKFQWSSKIYMLQHKFSTIMIGENVQPHLYLIVHIVSSVFIFF
jgi:hypothetical protein